MFDSVLSSLTNMLRLFVFFALLTWSCGKKNDAKNDMNIDINAGVVQLKADRVACGQDIRLSTTRRIKVTGIYLNGRLTEEYSHQGDSILIKHDTGKVGVVQIIVNGRTASNNYFADTMQLEILSDLVPAKIAYKIGKTYPHQVSSFTQGLEFYGDKLLEGTGEYGQSELKEVNLTDGTTIRSKKLSGEHFGEGVTVFNDKIYQLTWKSGVCLRYNTNFELDTTFNLYTQGWGLSHSDTSLLVSDGSNKIFFYNSNFEQVGAVEIYDNLGPVMKLNELEYVDGLIYANVWETNVIIIADVFSGKVVAEINLSDIVPLQVKGSQASVLNGIAFRAKDQSFYVTGKYWPTLFQIRLKPHKGLRNQAIW